MICGADSSLSHTPARAVMVAQMSLRFVVGAATIGSLLTLPLSPPATAWADFGTGAFASHDPGSRPEGGLAVTSLQGIWRLEKSSSPTPPTQIIFRDNKVHFSFDPFHPSPPKWFAYKLDSGMSPQAIDLIAGEAESLLGLVKVDADKMTISLHEPGKPRPASFARAFEVSQYKLIKPRQPALIAWLNSLSATFRVTPDGWLVGINCALTSVADKDLHRLGEVASLRKLYFFDTKITSEGLKHLTQLNLDELVLVKTQINDDAVSVLSKMESLKELNVVDTALSPPAVSKLRAALPGCRVVGGTHAPPGKP